METLQSDLLNAVNEYLSERVGLYFTELRFADLERGLHSTAAELDYSDLDSCINDLLSGSFNKAMLQILVRNLTIGETYFFRDPGVFLSLEDKILPGLIKRKKGLRLLRIWSAGCSTGEEPYSIAISIMRSLHDYQNYHLSLLATDINTRSLEKAQQASYSLWSFRTMPEDFLSCYFENSSNSGLYQAKESLRRMVTFDYLNLAEDPYPALAGNTNCLDILFCRNVLIYFNQQKCKEIADKLSACLNPGGYLITSASDSARLINQVPPDLERLNATTFRKRIQH
jgi:chemotaxis protein methyltransferase CheR